MYCRGVLSRNADGAISIFATMMMMETTEDDRQEQGRERSKSNQAVRSLTPEWDGNKAGGGK